VKKHFADKIFSDELEVWSYLQTLKNIDLGVEDGHYFGEFVEDALCQLHLRCALKFSDRKMLVEVLYVRPRNNSRFYLHVKDGKAFCIGIDSAYVSGHLEIENNEWKLAFFRDRMSEFEVQNRQFSAREYAQAAEALMELFVVNAKKVV
jgi:hypothetical protein